MQKRLSIEAPINLPPPQEPPAIVFNIPSQPSKSFANYYKQQNQGQNFNLTQDFINYIAKVENSVRAGFKNGRWYPHKSVEGGLPTIAYGHKLKQGENYSAGISDTQATQLLLQDIKNAAEAAKRLINHEFGSGAWEKLDNTRKEMLVDFAFNGVLNKFPLFRQSVVGNDINLMRKEYKRYTKGKELKNRNAVFFTRYLN